MNKTLFRFLKLIKLGPCYSYYRTYKRDDRCLFLYVHSDDFQIYFASDSWRQKFNGYVHRITEGFEETGFIADLDTDVGSTSIPVSSLVGAFFQKYSNLS